MRLSVLIQTPSMVERRVTARHGAGKGIGARRTHRPKVLSAMARHVLVSDEFLARCVDPKTMSTAKYRMSADGSVAFDFREVLCEPLSALTAGECVGDGGAARWRRRARVGVIGMTVCDGPRLIWDATVVWSTPWLLFHLMGKRRGRRREWSA